MRQTKCVAGYNKRVWEFYCESCDIRFSEDGEVVTRADSWRPKVHHVTVCLMHGVPHSQNPPHWAGYCLYCVLCFKELRSLDDCFKSGESYEDICHECAVYEALIMAAKKHAAEMAKGIV